MRHKRTGRLPIAPVIERRWQGPGSLDDLIDSMARPRFSYSDALDLIELNSGIRPHENTLRGWVRQRRRDMGIAS